MRLTPAANLARSPQLLPEVNVLKGAKVSGYFRLDAPLPCAPLQRSLAKRGRCTRRAFEIGIVRFERAVRSASTGAHTRRSIDSDVAERFRDERPRAANPRRPLR
jgi:hypothetical protein